MLAAMSSVALSAAGCKKNVDPNAFDAGAPAVVAQPVVAAPVEVPDAAAPLAPLAAAATAPAVVKKPTVKPDAGAATPKVDSLALQECTNARSFCTSPKAKQEGSSTKKLCEQFTAECKAKGGTVPQ